MLTVKYIVTVATIGASHIIEMKCEPENTKTTRMMKVMTIDTVKMVNVTASFSPVFLSKQILLLLFSPPFP